MDTNEAIRKLQQIKQVKKQSEANSQSNTIAKGLMNFKNILVGVIVDTASLIMGNNFSVTVKNFPRQDKLEKLIKETNKELIEIKGLLVKLSNEKVTPNKTKRKK
jgi:hypothetical protein